MFWMSKSTLGGFVKMQKEKDRHGLGPERKGIEIKRRCPAASGEPATATGGMAGHSPDIWSGYPYYTIYFRIAKKSSAYKNTKKESGPRGSGSRSGFWRFDQSRVTSF